MAQKLADPDSQHWYLAFSGAVGEYYFLFLVIQKKDGQSIAAVIKVAFPFFYFCYETERIFLTFCHL
jgi:hypothetical protein